MDDGMFNLIQAMVGVFVMLFIGQMIRRLMLTTPEERKYPHLLGKIFLFLTIPATIFNALYAVKSLPHEGIWLAITCLLWEVMCVVISTFMFARMSDGRLRAACTLTTTAFNSGLFYPIMDTILGTRGVALLVLFDIANNLWIFAFMTSAIPVIMSPKWMATFRHGPKKLEEVPTPIESNHVTAGTVELSVVSVEPTPAKEAQASQDNSSASSSSAPSVVAPTIDSQEKVEQEAKTDVEAGKKESADEEKHKKKGKFAFLRDPRVRRALMNPPVLALILGLILGLSHANVPSIILYVINIPAKGNALVAYLLVGASLDTSKDILKKLWKPTVVILLFRYILGISFGIIMYATVGRYYMTSYGRLVSLIAWVLPLASGVQVNCLMMGADSVLPALLVTLTVLISFPVIMVMLAIVGIPAKTA